MEKYLEVKKKARGWLGLDAEERQMSGLKDRLHLDESLSRTGERVVFKRQVKIPWYSPYRERNAIVFCVLCFCVLFAAPISGIVKGSQHQSRLEKDRLQFLRELDLQEQLESQGRLST